jgi:large subunit ribosomal protein L30
MATAKAAAKTQKKITVRLKKGLMGCDQEQRATVKGLGLRHREHVVTLENTSSVRGMIKKVIHLVDVVSES